MEKESGERSRSRSRSSFIWVILFKKGSPTFLGRGHLENLNREKQFK
jgi:hypothetical protein